MAKKSKQVEAVEDVKRGAEIAFEAVDEVPTMKKANTRASVIVAKLKELDKPGQWVRVTEAYNNNSSATALARTLKSFEGINAVTRAKCVYACIEK
jgi:hypothetical protein